MGTISLSKEQMDYIVEKTAITDPKAAIEYFAELMVMEKIHPKDMQTLVRKMMQRDRNKK